MKTTLISVLNLCAPCYCHCRYCLLSWDGKCLGIDYDRSIAYARRLHDWLKNTHHDIRFMYSFGYSMEHPNLPEAISFMQETNSPGGRFLQLNGMKMRTTEELHSFFDLIKKQGIELIDFTLYGTEEYHDKFAGRKEDFRLVIDSLNAALEKGFKVEIGIPITKENISQADDLINILPEDKVKIYLFVPHSGGRGISLAKSKITVDDYENLSAKVRQHFNRSKYLTPSEWRDTPLPAAGKRALTLSLLPANIDRLEQQSFEDTLKELQKTDEDYYSRVPEFQTLLQLYVDPDDTHLYSRKDLDMLYRRRYIAENNIIIPDITDERFTGSLRY